MELGDVEVGSLGVNPSPSEESLNSATLTEAVKLSCVLSVSPLNHRPENFHRTSSNPRAVHSRH